MEKFLNNFMRKGDGIWECKHSTELKLPQGRIQVAPGTVLTKGTEFMGIDLVEMLEAAHRRARL